MTPEAHFHGPAAGNIINTGGQYGVCVTGDHNVVYQILVADDSEREALVAEIREGRKKPEALARAVPLPTLIVRIEVATPHSTSATLSTGEGAGLLWRITCHRPAAGAEKASSEIPSPLNGALERQLAAFYAVATKAVQTPEERRSLDRLAQSIGETLAGVVPLS